MCLVLVVGFCICICLVMCYYIVEMIGWFWIGWDFRCYFVVFDVLAFVLWVWVWIISLWFFVLFRLLLFWVVCFRASLGVLLVVVVVRVYCCLFCCFVFGVGVNLWVCLVWGVVGFWVFCLGLVCWWVVGRLPYVSVVYYDVLFWLLGGFWVGVF